MDDFADHLHLVKAPAASPELDDQEPGTVLAPPAGGRPLRRSCVETQADEIYQWQRGGSSPVPLGGRGGAVAEETSATTPTSPMPLGSFGSAEAEETVNYDPKFNDPLTIFPTA
eukprot:4953203-Heterocapsa_arctica.AAC.1